MPEQQSKWTYVFGVILVIYLVSLGFSYFFQDVKNSVNEKIVVLPLEGVITVDGGGSSLLSSGSGIVSGDVVKQLKDLDTDTSVKAVLLEINSPGGSAVASQEIANQIKAMHKPVYSVIREVGASGGYWIASSTNYIVASPLSITGSIGVISSYLQFNELFSKYGVTYERMVAGKYKDMGNPYANLTDEERAILQKKLDLIHDVFISTVAENRHLPEEKVRSLATGEFYLGSEAKKYGLIDSLGDRDTALTLLKQKINQTDIDVVDQTPHESFWSLLTKTSAFYFGQGFGTSFQSLSLQSSPQTPSV